MIHMVKNRLVGKTIEFINAEGIRNGVYLGMKIKKENR